VRGYKEQGNIDTPLEIAIKNQIDRFNLVIDVIERVPELLVSGGHVREKMENAIIEHSTYAFENGVDKPEITNWKWPY
jgi:xylulose-5-phosphate/fructose-6-phosphate phosphoketolase